MQRRISTFLAHILIVLFTAITCVCQNYTVTILSGSAYGINASGQIAGSTGSRAVMFSNGNVQDLGLDSAFYWSLGWAINDSGQIAGYLLPTMSSPCTQGFLYSGGNIINFGEGFASAINNAGDVVIASCNPADLLVYHASTAVTDNLGRPPEYFASATGMAINNYGQIAGSVVASASSLCFENRCGFLYEDGAFKSLGTLPNCNGSDARHINDSGQIVGAAEGCSDVVDPHHWKAFLYDSNTSTMQPLGFAAGGTYSYAMAINNQAHAVGFGDTPSGRHALLFRNGTVADLNDLIPQNSGTVLIEAYDISDSGRIVGTASTGAFLLTPVVPYHAVVQPPVNAEGTSIFSAKRGVVPVKFALTKDEAPTCEMPPATISVTRTAGGTLGVIDESTYVMAADNGPNFRIDSCQYVYNLASASLGTGAYRVDITINGTLVGNAVFALK